MLVVTRVLVGDCWLAVQLAAPAVAAAAARSPPSPPVDLDRSEPTLFVVPYAHLDTEWRWDYPTTIREYLPKTIRDNFALLREVPALHLQLQRREPLPDDQGVLPGRLREGEAVHRRRPLVPVRIVDGGERRQLAVGRVDHPPGALRHAVLQARVRQDERRVHAARLLRLPRLAAEHPRATPASRTSRRRSSRRAGSRRRRSAAPTRPRRRQTASRSTSASGKAPTATASSPRSTRAATASRSPTTSARRRRPRRRRPPASAGAPARRLARAHRAERPGDGRLHRLHVLRHRRHRRLADRGVGAG